ncbi:glomulin-like isoform X1 [Pecten maximus]|uniref:glomulin-like isoform X1 n=1 Tax=Pecten maximus TaxID=6579 RepID=UPI0014588043|nr:glomulin-like isoform X1 [Pecten maximus]
MAESEEMADNVLSIDGQAKAAEETLHLIKESLKFYDSKGLKTLILEEKLSDQSIYWEVATELTKHLTAENFEKYTVFFESCQRCLNYLVKTGNAKELLLALLEQTDTFNDDVKWKALLDGIQQTLLKLPSKRYHSLDIALSTIHAHIKSLPEPTDHELEGEENKLLELDSEVQRITDVLLGFLAFVEPFVLEVSMNNSAVDRQKSKHQIVMLQKYLLSLLNHPLVFLDLAFCEKQQERKAKGYARMCVEKTMKFLCELCPNFFKTITDSLEDIELSKLSAKRSVEKKEEDEKEVSDFVDNWAECKDEGLIPLPSLACLSYLLLVEGLGLEHFPVVYTHKYLLEFNLQFVLLLFQKQESLIVSKGVRLLEVLIRGITPATFTVEDLDNPNYTKTLNCLINVMIRCPVKEVRGAAVQMFSTYIQMFTLPARVQIYEMIFNTCRHSGVVGYSIQLVKDQIDTTLKQENPDTEFLGLNLKRMLKFVSQLEEGAESDLLESSDRVIPTLNLIRYLILRDPIACNVTGFWSYYEDLEKEFFGPLRLALDFSKSHYKLELQNFKEGKASVEKGMELGVNISVAGMPMPKVPRSQQIQIVESALNTFDLIDSLLSRIIELADSQLKASKTEIKV